MKAAALSILSVFLFLVSNVQAQITVPDRVDPHTPIVAGCNCVTPEGSEVKIQWTISDGAHLIPVGNSAHVWAPPGTYEISTSVVWMQFEEIEVKVGDGTKRKIRSLLAWDLQTFEKTFTVGPDPGPNPNPGPNPGPNPSPTGFEAQILAALQAIGNPDSRKKVAKIYSEVAEKANTRRDVYKPALMVDEAKTRVASELTPAELQTWRNFWPKMNEAMRGRQMEEDDTDAFITAFRELSQILNR